MTDITPALTAVMQKIKDFRPKIALVLGSGLSDVSAAVEQAITIPYSTIPGLRASEVIGHCSELVLGYIQGVPVMCYKGRLHFYEGATSEMVQIFIYLAKGLGCDTIVVTGAVGSMRKEMGPGEVMLLTDHINLQGRNPLVGPNDANIGPRFVSLEGAYDTAYRKQLYILAKKLNINLHEGVYVAVLGPSFETPAEIRAFRLLGGDVVGMSVVPEVIVARHCGLRVIGIAAVTNLAVGLSPVQVTHEVTLQYASEAQTKVSRLIHEFIREQKSLTVSTNTGTAVADTQHRG